MAAASTEIRRSLIAAHVLRPARDDHDEALTPFKNLAREPVLRIAEAGRTAAARERKQATDGKRYMLVRESLRELWRQQWLQSHPAR